MTDDEPAQAPEDGATAASSKDRRPPSMDDSAWGMFGYVLAGIVYLGGLGWLIDRWLDLSPVFLPIGVLAGAAAGIYLGYMKFLRS